MLPRSSIVRYAIHRLASRTYGSTIAAVGQASMHRRQFPHKSGGGASPGASEGANSSEVMITPRKNIEPISSLIRQVFFPCQPSPACRATTRSRIGPVSTYRSEEHTSELQSQFHLVC